MLIETVLITNLDKYITYLIYSCLLNTHETVICVMCVCERSMINVS